MNVSVIIPCYNAATWLPKTIPKICIALENAGIKKAEIIVVDDGSSDGSADVAKKLIQKYKINVVKQPNKGRLVARQLGIENAQYEYVLLIDTRIYIEKNALKYVKNMISKYPSNTVWTSHVNIDKKGNIFARFWDAITCVAWRKYFSNPRYLTFGNEDFDLYPKGTTCLFLPKKLFYDATIWYIRNNENHNQDSNDDTTILRKISENNRISISPKYSSIYHARTNLKKFYAHAYHRGKVFIDGFFVKGNMYYFTIILFILLSIPILLTLTFVAIFYIKIFALLILAYIAITTLVLKIFKINWADTFAFIIVFPLFSIAYGSGLWVAYLQKILK